MKSTFLCFAALLLAACGLAMSNEDRLDRAEEALVDGDYRAAIIDTKDVLRKEPDNIRARILLGRASIKSNDVVSAEKELTRAIELGVDPSVVAVDLGRALVGIGNFDQALEKVTTDLAVSDEDRLKILQIRGDAMLGLGRTESARELFTQILDSIDNDVPAQLGIVSSYLAERNFVQARATMDHVLTTSADAIDAWLLSGRMHFERRNAELAETHFDKALGLAVSQKNNIAREMALMGLTESLLAQNKTELARESVQELTTLSPNAPGTKYLSARIAYLDQDWERAQALLQEVLQFVPDNRLAQILLGSVHLQNGNLEQAEMYLTAVVASSPDNADARNLLAQTRLRQKDTNAAQALLRPMLDADAPNAYALALAAQTSVQTGDLDEAVKYLQRRAELSTDDPDAELDLAAAYLMADRIDDAQALLENAEFSEAGTNEFRRDILMVLSLMKSDKLGAALTEVDAVIEKWPQSTRALSLKAAVEMRVGDTDAARKNLAMAADLNPGDVLPLRLLGAIEEDEGNFQAAKDSYLKIVEYLPDDARNLMALARISQRMNDLAGARHWLERSVAADPGNLSVRKVLRTSHTWLCSS
jgi:putative PEP-CTERM system TPR-repeat lipoprotein